jgi:hypothetical protein
LGKLTFTDEQLDATKQSLEESGATMPQFGNIENALAAEMKEPTEEESGILFDIIYLRFLILYFCIERLAFLKQNEESIIIAQSQARVWLAKRQLARLRAEEKERLRRAKEQRQRLFKENEKKVVSIQSAWRMKKAKDLYQKKLHALKENERLFVKVFFKY